MNLDELELKLEGYVPFTPVNIVSRHLNKDARDILDLGCGKGDPMLFLNKERKYYVMGAEIFPEYIKICEKKMSHDVVIEYDLKELEHFAMKFDVVLGLRILEHFTKEDGIKILDNMERIANKQVIITTPIEQFRQSAYDDNKFQEHKYIWSPEELKARGYRIYLNGIKGFQFDSATITKRQKIVSYFGHVLWSISGFIVFFIPSMAANMVAVKDL